MNNIYCGLSCYTGCGSSRPCHNGFLDKPKETGCWPCGFGTKRCCWPCSPSPESRGVVQMGLSRRRGTSGSWEEEKGASCPGARAGQSPGSGAVCGCVCCVTGSARARAGVELPRAALILGPCYALLPPGMRFCSRNLPLAQVPGAAQTPGSVFIGFSWRWGCCLGFFRPQLCQTKPCCSCELWRTG